MSLPHLLSCSYHVSNTDARYARDAAAPWRHGLEMVAREIGHRIVDDIVPSERHEAGGMTLCWTVAVLPEGEYRELAALAEIGRQYCGVPK